MTTFYPYAARGSRKNLGMLALALALTFDETYTLPGCRLRRMYEGDKTE